VLLYRFLRLHVAAREAATRLDIHDGPFVKIFCDRVDKGKQGNEGGKKSREYAQVSSVTKICKEREKKKPHANASPVETYRIDPKGSSVRKYSCQAQKKRSPLLAKGVWLERKQSVTPVTRIHVLCKGVAAPIEPRTNTVSKVSTARLTELASYMYDATYDSGDACHQR